MFRKIVNTCKAAFRREAVLMIAAACAVLSMFFVPPDGEYLSYIDLRVLCLLFCLMAVVAGFQQCGLFYLLAQKLLSGKKQFRLLSLILVLLPFFSSMVITNDVALITFVPFTILVMGMIGEERRLIYLIVLQTVAANLGSMATPVGNPQNLYLYSQYGLSPGDFFAIMGPLTLLSLISLCAAACAVKSDTIEVHFAEQARIQKPGILLLMAGLFLLCLLSVFRVIPYWALLIVVVAALLIFDRELFLRADYGLLLTFVCFFVFAGNMGRIGPVREFLDGMLRQSAVLTSAVTSQVISNVPAAVLLSGFTQNGRGLLIGTNIGGLGTLIASLASLISFKFYIRTPKATPLKYLAVFTLVNGAGLLLLLGAAAFI